jgi:hypothetical protein
VVDSKGYRTCKSDCSQNATDQWGFNHLKMKLLRKAFIVIGDCHDGRALRARFAKRTRLTCPGPERYLAHRLQSGHSWSDSVTPCDLVQRRRRWVSHVLPKN